MGPILVLVTARSPDGTDEPDQGMTLMATDCLSSRKRAAGLKLVRYWNTGAGFVRESLDEVFYAPAEGEFGFTFNHGFMMDYNQDGKSDLVLPSRAGGPLSTGTTM